MPLLSFRSWIAALFLLVVIPSSVPAAPAAPAAPPAAPAPAAPAESAAARTPFPYPGDALFSKGGASLRLVETGRQRTPSTVQVNYRLEAGEFPPGKVYRLWQMSLADQPEALCGALVADSTGALVPDAAAAVHETSACPPLALIDLGAFEYLPGEPYRVAIISSDSTVQAVATAFPHPIEGADGPHRILLEMTSANRRSFTLWGVGFGKDKGIRTSMTTAGETYEGGAFSDAQGVVRILLNAPAGVPGGVVTYEVRGPSGSPQLRYRWGQAR